MKKAIVLLVLIAAALCAQSDGVAVNQVAGPPPRALQQLVTYSGSNISYICWALSTQPRPSSAISISAATNANPVVLTSTGHALNATSLPQITIKGGTGNWAAINGTFTATITGANTFTIPVDSTSLGALAGTVTFTTSAPRTNQSVWAVQSFAYDGSNNLIGAYWVGGAAAYANACSAPTQYQ